MVTVCTVLPPPERPRIDAAGDGCFDTLHAESLREVLYVARPIITATIRSFDR